MQAIEFSTIPHSGVLQIPEAHRKEWEGLPVRVILLPDKQAPSDNKSKTLLERLRTVEKIYSHPDLAENHDAYVNGQDNGSNRFDI
ncbi:MAG: hypothetical protein R3F02_11575 [Thiolinea sp.]